MEQSFNAACAARRRACLAHRAATVPVSFFRVQSTLVTQLGRSCRIASAVDGEQQIIDGEAQFGLALCCVGHSTRFYVKDRCLAFAVMQDYANSVLFRPRRALLALIDYDLLATIR